MECQDAVRAINGFEKQSHSVASKFNYAMSLVDFVLQRTALLS